MQTYKQEKRIHSYRDFELCYLRHKYLRRVKHSPTSKEMLPYRRIVINLSRIIFLTNTNLFCNVGIVLDDIISISQTHLVSFLDLFSLGENKNTDKYQEFKKIFKNKYNKFPGKKDILGKNKANFTIFLKQRMSDLIRICKQKHKNIKGVKIEYEVYYGAAKPPKNKIIVLDNLSKYDYKKCDYNYYRSIRKHLKKKHGLAFQFAGNWYVPIPVKSSAIDMYDISTSKINPYENLHNMNPEQIYFKQEETRVIEANFEKFKKSSNKEKLKTVLNFVEKNEDNPNYKEEIATAKKMISRLEKSNVRE